MLKYAGRPEVPDALSVGRHRIHTNWHTGKPEKTFIFFYVVM
jgi:hypothetical protein